MYTKCKAPSIRASLRPEGVQLEGNSLQIYLQPSVVGLSLRDMTCMTFKSVPALHPWYHTHTHGQVKHYQSKSFQPSPSFSFLIIAYQSIHLCLHLHSLETSDEQAKVTKADIHSKEFNVSKQRKMYCIKCACCSDAAFELLNLIRVWLTYLAALLLD